MQQLGQGQVCHESLGPHVDNSPSGWIGGYIQPAPPCVSFCSTCKGHLSLSRVVASPKLITKAFPNISCKHRWEGIFHLYQDPISDCRNKIALIQAVSQCGPMWDIKKPPGRLQSDSWQPEDEGRPGFLPNSVLVKNQLAHSEQAYKIMCNKCLLKNVGEIFPYLQGKVTIMSLKCRINCISCRNQLYNQVPHLQKKKKRKEMPDRYIPYIYPLW